jgi:hypothetical protein
MVAFNSESLGCVVMAWEIAASIFVGAGTKDEFLFFCARRFSRLAKVN